MGWRPGRDGAPPSHDPGRTAKTVKGCPRSRVPRVHQFRGRRTRPLPIALHWPHVVCLKRCASGAPARRIRAGLRGTGLQGGLSPCSCCTQTPSSVVAIVRMLPRDLPHRTARRANLHRSRSAPPQRRQAHDPVLAIMRRVLRDARKVAPGRLRRAREDAASVQVRLGPSMGVGHSIILRDAHVS